MYEEEFYRETGHEKSRIEELTEFDGQLDLFDTFEPEEILKDSDATVSLLGEIPGKEFQQDLLHKDNVSENLEIKEGINELHEDENVELVEDGSSNKKDQNQLEEGEVFDEAVNAVFGEKKVTEIDTWARKEAEAMSARAEEGARKDKNFYQKESTRDIDSKDIFNRDDSKSNVIKSMKEIKKDLKSLSELINTAPAKIKDSDKGDN